MEKQRNKKNEPEDYKIGWKPFWDCKIDLSLKPLIPRVETEFWAEKAVLEIKKFKKARVLDIFAGSGCIGVTVLKHCANIKVDFAEIDKKLLKQIKINLIINKVNNRKSKIIKSDIFSKVGGKYDFILANPPYISTKTKLPKSVINFEPRLALFAGASGLENIKKFLYHAKKHLNKNGQIWMEFGYGQKNKIQKIIKKCGYAKYFFRKDQYDRWRYAVIFWE